MHPHRQRGVEMAKCETCGNDYDKAFEVTMAGESHVFDSFECAIHALAPICAQCGVRIVGHGLEQDGEMYCCAHCAQHMGANALRDRARSEEHTSELQSLMRISYAVFCLKKKNILKLPEIS